MPANQTAAKFWTKALTGFVLFVAALILAAAVGHFFPSVNDGIMGYINRNFAALGKWLSDQQLAPHLLTVAIAAMAGLWQAGKLASKLLGASVWKRSVSWVQNRVETAGDPDGCYPLASLRDKLFPTLGAQSGQEVPFYGRADDLQWLADECAIAKTHKALRVLSIWGEQGIGKTHLTYRFAKALAVGGYPSCGKWAVYGLNKDFDCDKLLNKFPDKPTLLLCDDVSLQDVDTTARLRALRKACAGRAQAIVLVVTTWSAASAGGITADQILVDAERPCGGLAIEFAEQIYPNARELPANMQGHPLYLRLLAAQAPAANLAPDSLWVLCQRWGRGYNSRLQTEHGLTDNALAALAVVSSSDTGVLTDIAKVIGLTKGDFAALEKTGRVSFHQGAKVLNPIKPDLLGWAFALSALQNLGDSQSNSYANLAWENDFFDTGRFMEHALKLGYLQHAWAKALRQTPADSLSEHGAMARAKAATNAVAQYGGAQRFDDMVDELAVARGIAKRFANNPEIQLERARAATNAVADYGGAQRFDDMADELAVAQDIAKRFANNLEIQLTRAEAATNAVADYGGAQRFDKMADELAVVKIIAADHKANLEIQLRLARCYGNQIPALLANGRAADDAVAALIDHLVSYPELAEQPPFNELFSAFRQDHPNQSQ